MTETQHTEEGDHVVIVDKHGKRHHGVAVLLDSDDVVREQVGGFMHFLRDYAVVGLAVGFIIGQQAQGVIKQLVDSFVTPVLDVMFGSSLQNESFRLVLGANHATVAWGKFVYLLLEFVVVMIVIYAAVKFFKLDRLAVKKK
jgi:large conductance mechanosensitive channel